MGKRKEEKYGKLRELLEANREAMTPELEAMARRKFGQGTTLKQFAFKMLHRRVFICTLQLQTEQGDLEWQVVGKRSPRYVFENASMMAVWNAGFNGAGPYGVRMPEPLGVSEAAQILFIEHIEGHSARTLLRENGTVEVARMAARALAQLHNLKLSIDADSSVVFTANHRMLRPLREAFPDQTPRIDALLAEAVALEAANKDSIIACHGDYHIAQLVVGDSDQSVWLIDFGSMGMTDPGYDLGEYLAHMVPAEKFDGVTEAREIFVQEYCRLTDDAIAKRVPVYEALSWLRRAMHNMRDNEEGEGREFVGSLLERAFEARYAG